jgi:hypothetical protein
MDHCVAAAPTWHELLDELRGWKGTAPFAQCQRLSSAPAVADDNLTGSGFGTRDRRPDASYSFTIRSDLTRRSETNPIARVRRFDETNPIARRGRFDETNPILRVGRFDETNRHDIRWVSPGPMKMGDLDRVARVM